MRYELYVQRLPGLAPEALAERVEDLPKGLSTGALEKALRDKQLPSVAIAWSEHREDIDAIAQRLVRLGAECDVRDNAPLAVKLSTWLLPQKKKQKAKPLVRFRARKHKPKRDWVGELSQRLLPDNPVYARALRSVLLFIGGFVARWVVFAGLYVGYLAAVEGQHNLTPQTLALPLAALAAGVLSAQVLAMSSAAMITGQLHVALAVPPIVASIASVVFALQQQEVRVSTRELRPTLAEEQAAVEAASKPPAEIAPMPVYPFEGLFEELRIRKEKGTIPELTVAEVEPTEAELKGIPGAKMAATTNTETPDEPAAPAAQPTPARAPSEPAEAPEAETANEPKPAVAEAPTPAPAPAHEEVSTEAPWPVYFGLSQPASMALLVGSWALALALGAALVWALRRKQKDAVAPAGDAAEADSGDSASDAKNEEASKAAQAALREATARAEQLEAQLEEARKARKAAESKLVAIEALSSGQVQELTEKLEAATTQLELLSQTPAPPAATPPANANAHVKAGAPRAPARPVAAAATPQQAAPEKAAPHPKPAPRRGTYTLADVEEERIQIPKQRE